MITKILRATFVSIILAPFLLVSIHVLAFQLNLARYGIYLTLYNGREIPIFIIVKWLLFMEEDALKGSNFVSIIFTWLTTWYVAADWVKDYRVSVVNPILVLFVGILYLAAWRHTEIILYFPETLYLFVTSWIVELTLYIKRRLRRPKTFFERLEEVGITFPKEYKISLKLPIRCPSCGADLYSSPEYCWKCGIKIDYGKIGSW